jgi:hypothetical protein
MGETSYQAKVRREIEWFAAASKTDDHPPIYDYWADTYIRPRLRSVLGVETIQAFYIDHILERARGAAGSDIHILSLGAGDAELEVQIARGLLSMGVDRFVLHCLELSPVLIGRANQRIETAGLGSHVSAEQSDLNAALENWSRGSCLAVVANHILHHIVDLEGLFARVSRAIGDSGVFLTADMIGRNGHRRWPETLSLVNAVWETLPDELKYNHVFGVVDHVYRDWDCLVGWGFEGIRAQDILPLLLQNFQFEKFLAFGSFPDAFFNGMYGPNFLPNLPAHQQFVERLDEMNATLLELGVIKPTMMFAVLSNDRSPATRMWRNLSPQFSVRDPRELDLSGARQRSLSLETAREFATVRFGEGGSRAALRSGWGSSEDWGAWMVEKEGVLELPVPAAAGRHQAVSLRMHVTAFLPRRLQCRSFSFMAGGKALGGVTFWKTDEFPKTIRFVTDAPEDGRMLLRIVSHEEASPAEDGLMDERFLGLGVIDATVSCV